MTTFHDRTKDDDIKSLLARVPDRPLRAALETWLRYKLMKLHHVARSPFERTLYVDTVSNPFHEPDSELYKCANFVRQVERIVEAGLY